MLNPNASAWYQAEDRLNNLMCIIQQYHLSMVEGDTIGARKWYSEIHAALRHWSENMQTYMQAPEWNDATDEQYSVMMWSFIDGNPLSLLRNYTDMEDR